MNVSPFSELLKIIANYNDPHLYEEPDVDTIPDKQFPCIYCEDSFETEHDAIVHLPLCKKKLLTKKVCMINT